MKTYRTLYRMAIAGIIGFAFIDGLSSSIDFLNLKRSLLLSALVIVIVGVLYFLQKKSFINSSLDFTGVKSEIIISSIGVLLSFWLPLLLQKDGISTLNTAENVGEKLDYFNTTVDFKYDTLLKNYPVFENAEVVLRYGKFEAKGDFVNEKQKAYFEDIPMSYSNKTFVIYINGNFWTAKKDTIVLIPNNINEIVMVPDGSLSEVVGSVLDILTGIPIAEARVSIGDIFTNTDIYGRFKLFIPLGMQRKKQVISIYKDGYRGHEISVIPASLAEGTALLEKL